MNKLLALTLVLFATAPLSAGGIPSLLRDAQQLNAARRLRVTAEIALQTTIVNAKQQLFEEGHAAPLEVDMARLLLTELQCISDAVARYDQLVDEFVMASEQSACEPQTENLPGSAHASPAVADLSVQIAKKHAEARGRRGVLEAEVGYLAELLRRLQHANDGSAGARREIALAKQRLAMANSRLSMEDSQRRFAAKLEQLHLAENQLARPFEVADGNLQNVQQLAAILQVAWDVHRTTAVREALAARIEMRLKYQHRMAELERDHGDRPREADLQQAAIAEDRRHLRSLDRTLEEQHSDLDSHFRGHTSPGLSTTSRFPIDRNRDTPQASLDVTSARRRVAELTKLAAEDAGVENELQRAQLELDVAEARAECHRHQMQFVALPATRDPRVGSFDFNAAHEAEIKLADRRAALLNWKLFNLNLLRKDGYATWKEVAVAERDLAIAEAERRSIIETHEIAMLYLERDRLVRDSADRITMTDRQAVTPHDPKSTTQTP